MKKWRVLVILALVAALAAPAFANPVPPRGVSPEQMAELMKQRGLPAQIGKDSNGALIISSRAVDVNFDVYFYECEAGFCRDIQFAAGWSESKATPERVNEWNTTKRFVRAYWKEGGVLWAEQDARISRGTTENINEQLALWPQMLTEFKQFMNL